MTRTAQNTNDVMKVLALVTVFLVPGSLIAGLLGMNVEVPLPKEGPVSFWLVVVAIVVLATGSLGGRPCSPLDLAVAHPGGWPWRHARAGGADRHDG